ncbi:MAG TPA: hypothetical protein VLM75_08400 [Spirochaetota bacterium]|nr:hypothetical protein [Spirochaetota bacterium]
MNTCTLKRWFSGQSRQFALFFAAVAVFGFSQRVVDATLNNFLAETFSNKRVPARLHGAPARDAGLPGHLSLGALLFRGKPPPGGPVARGPHTSAPANASASRERKRAIGEINTAVLEVDRVTRNNSSLAGETAAIGTETSR